LRWPIVTKGRLVRMGLSTTSSAFAGFRFPREVITVAVRWYLRYGLSYRDVEELLADRGIRVDHVTVSRANTQRGSIGLSWRVMRLGGIR
jgi:transposase-like protein